jgi:pimeloyl-ACP methyl ester carboxylesterase/DNA-binding CsgD family transcriptional regulator
MGLSERALSDLSLDQQVRDARAVLEAAGEASVAVFGRGLGGPAAIALAASLPERVSHLILFGSGARVVHRDAALPPRLAEALGLLSEASWPLASRTLAELMLPEARPEAVAWYAEYQQAVASPEVAAALVRSAAAIDVRDLLPKVRAPSLVIHRRDDRSASLEGARELAAGLAQSRLVVLEGSATLPYLGNWQAVVSAIRGFLNPTGGRLTWRERELLALLAEGLSNREAAARLGVSESTVARHLANAYLKLGVGSRSAAVARARAAGIL